MLHNLPSQLPPFLLLLFSGITYQVLARPADPPPLPNPPLTKPPPPPPSPPSWPGDVCGIFDPNFEEDYSLKLSFPPTYCWFSSKFINRTSVNFWAYSTCLKLLGNQTNNPPNVDTEFKTQLKEVIVAKSYEAGSPGSQSGTGVDFSYGGNKTAALYRSSEGERWPGRAVTNIVFAC